MRSRTSVVCGDEMQNEIHRLSRQALDERILSVMLQVEQRAKLVSVIPQLDGAHAPAGLSQNSGRVLQEVRISDRSLPAQAAFPDVVPLGSECHRLCFPFR
jgi:hypothetical protein